MKVINMFSPQKILSSASRERCVAKFKDLPTFLENVLASSKKASVLLPLCVIQDEVCLLYTLRSSNLKNHSGQVSFPGGKRDNGETEIETALRETEEEIGVSRKDIEIWGVMPEVQGRNNEFLITPVVGVIKNFDPSKLTCNTEEVEEVFTVPMSSLCDPNNQAYLRWRKFLMPVYIHGRHKIWGITGFITDVFLNCLLPHEIYLDKCDFKRKKYTMDELMSSKL